MPEFLSSVRFWRDHRWAPERMSAYLDGELVAGPRTRMERHLGNCVDCRRLAEELTLVIDAMRRLHAPEEGRDAVQFVASVRARLTEPPAS